MIINTQTNAFVFNYRVYGFIRDKFFTVDETRRDTNFRYVKSRVVGVSNVINVPKGNKGPKCNTIWP